jgi:hypothetical protein
MRCVRPDRTRSADGADRGSVVRDRRPMAPRRTAIDIPTRRTIHRRRPAGSCLAVPCQYRRRHIERKHTVRGSRCLSRSARRLARAEVRRQAWVATHVAGRYTRGWVERAGRAVHRSEGRVGCQVRPAARPRRPRGAGCGSSCQRADRPCGDSGRSPHLGRAAHRPPLLVSARCVRRGICSGDDPQPAAAFDRPSGLHARAQAVLAARAPAWLAAATGHSGRTESTAYPSTTLADG